MTDIALSSPARAAPESTTSADSQHQDRHHVGTLGKVPAVMIWLPVAAVALGAASLWHFVSFAFISNPVLNGLILAVASWGSFTTIGHVARAYREEKVFVSGMEWLRRGAWGNAADPKYGQDAFVLGMLDRLEKLGLGHQVHMQSAVAEPEIEAMEHFFEKRQELSQFLVGLMVGLGLLGTFVGLLETLIATSHLISTIASSVGGGASGGGGTGGGMEAEFAHIVGGLQKPLEAMGTAFSASMFGLIGSIMLGFQMIIVRKTCARLVDNIREDVLALAEKSDVAKDVEITERFLATLLSDMLEQHRQSREELAGLSRQMSELIHRVSSVTTTSVRLSEDLDAHREEVRQTVSSLQVMRDIAPLLRDVAANSGQALEAVRRGGEELHGVARHLPDVATLSHELSQTRADLAALSTHLAGLLEEHRDLAVEVRGQSAAIRRLDTVLWNEERRLIKNALTGADEDSRSA